MFVAVVLVVAAAAAALVLAVASAGRAAASAAAAAALHACCVCASFFSPIRLALGVLTSSVQRTGDPRPPHRRAVARGPPARSRSLGGPRRARRAPGRFALPCFALLCLCFALLPVWLPVASRLAPRTPPIEWLTFFFLGLRVE